MPARTAFNPDQSSDRRLMRQPEVGYRTGLPKSTMYFLIGRGSFPRPVRLGSRSVGWPADEINLWLAQRQRTGT